MEGIITFSDAATHTSVNASALIDALVALIDARHEIRRTEQLLWCGDDVESSARNNYEDARELVTEALSDLLLGSHR